jgi:hypothetical protein
MRRAQDNFRHSTVFTNLYDNAGSVHCVAMNSTAWPQGCTIQTSHTAKQCLPSEDQFKARVTSAHSKEHLPKPSLAAGTADRGTQQHRSQPPVSRACDLQSGVQGESASPGASKKASTLSRRIEKRVSCAYEKNVGDLTPRSVGRASMPLHHACIRAAAVDAVCANK